MTHAVWILRRAQKELAQLPTGDYERVHDAIRALSQEPLPPGCRKLTGHEGWRMRVDNYRVICVVGDEQQTVTILHISHRRDMYR